MKFRYITNFSNQEATMLLYNEIGMENGVNGAAFAQEIFHLDNQGCKLINVRINSPGGSILDGYSIFSAIQSTKCRVDTYNDGIAASIAGIIFQAGKKRNMADYAMFMMHNPQMQLQNQKDVEIMNIFKASLNTILSGKSGMDSSEIDTMMNIETWLDSSQTLEKGLCDAIYSSSSAKKPQLALSNSTQKLWNITNRYLTQKNMNKVTNLLGLTTDANEDSIAIAIQNNLKAYKDATDTIANLTNACNVAKEELVRAKEESSRAITELSNQLLEKEKAEKAAHVEDIRNKANMLVNEAIKLGKIANTAKDIWVNMLEKDYEQAKGLIEGLGINLKSVQIPSAGATEPVLETANSFMAKIKNKTKV